MDIEHFEPRASRNFGRGEKPKRHQPPSLSKPKTLRSTQPARGCHPMRL